MNDPADVIKASPQRSRSRSSTGSSSQGGGGATTDSPTTRTLKRNNRSLSSLPSTALLPAASFSSSQQHDEYELGDEYDDISPHRYEEHPYGSLQASSTLRHVTRVSKRAALASKKVIWDSNDNAIDAALSAVDQWEDVYSALRGLLVASAQSAKGLYGAAKVGAMGLEHGILVPVRDWILLPAFGGVERATEKTVGFLQSDQAALVARQTLQLAKQVPWVGQTMLGPAMVLSVQIIQTSWEIAKYPIPSRQQVRASVNFVLTGTKWAITTAVREVSLYMKRADAIITRTLSHTQWKVLGSGPYATLDKLNKQEVIDLMCERYFSLTGTVTRYEFAAHIRAHNLPLYLDLVLTGLLRERGGELTKDDEWLSSCPSYRKNSKVPFLLPNYDHEVAENGVRSDPEAYLSDKESALWFRLPYINGKRPSRDMPWVRFSGEDRTKLESRYLDVYKEGKVKNDNVTRQNTAAPQNPQAPSDSEFVTDAANDGDTDNGEAADKSDLFEDLHVSSQYPTLAQWYVPNLASDVMVDQKRFSVSINYCCPRCRQRHDPATKREGLHPPMRPPKYGELCQQCLKSQAKITNYWMASSILSPPPLSMVMRPNLWRFHGPGDEVRRAVWFLDTRRHGLQPYGQEAQAVLEDAFLFLQWRNEQLKEGIAENERKSPKQQPVSESTCRDDGKDISDINKAKDLDDDPLGEDALLTVQVESPDGGEQQLVQFSSLTSATAIRHGLGGAITLFKRRVYRGADLSVPKAPETILGVTPDDIFSGDIDLKSQSISDPHHIEGPDDISLEESKIELESQGDHRFEDEEEYESDVWSVLPLPSEEESLAVPASQFDNSDRVSRRSISEDEYGDDIDHLVLIVHGIGEMLQSAVPLFGLNIPNLSSIIDCCGFLRKNHAEVQNARFSQMYPTAESTSRASTGRVEYLPIEWHEAFSIVSQRMSPADPGEPAASSEGGQLVRSSGRSSQVMMKDISLRTIPQMRSFANDTLMDVLYFMSIEHHDIIVDIVTKEMNVVVQKFRALTGFHGRVSIIGHSLGSIITWDILEHQFQAGSSGSTGGGAREDNEYTEDLDSGSPIVDQMPEALNPSSFSLQTSRFQYPKLRFDVDNAFMLGSPIAVFLMVRNQRKPLNADFSLSGCHRVFNIFHPYDPVAYRIEPLIDPRNAEFEPKIMTHWNGGFRVQYQTKRLWRRLVQTTMKTQQNLIQSLEAGFAGMGLLDSTGEGCEEDNESQPNTPMNGGDRSTGRVVTGKLNQGRRVDYMLQEKEIEAANEYVAAFAAHSGYWIEKDLSLFIARQIYLNRLAHEQALHFEDIQPQEDNVRSETT